MGDVFSSTCGRDDHDSRICKITAARQLVRVRSGPLWCSLHWCDQSILCAGDSCPACEAGFPKRRYSFVAVDRPGSCLAVLQLTEKDWCLLSTLDNSVVGMTRIGSQFRVWRPASRQPMAAEYLGFTADLISIPQEVVIVDLLRIHGIRATEADVRTGGFRRLTAAKAHEAAKGRRVTA
jgi:hypothetical protein